MSARRPRRADAASDAGTDSFLDILANLVGILVILVVVVAIRVQRTVREPVAALPAPTLEDRPLDVAFAAPKPSRLPDPEPDAALLADVERLKSEAAALRKTLGDLPVATDLPDDTAGLDALRMESDALQKKTDGLIALTAARTRDLARLEREQGRLVRELEQLDDPPAKVETLQHEVRALARAASREQAYVHLERGRLTLLPTEELIKLAMRHQRTNFRNAAYDGVYRGTVGPVEGVTLSYEARRAAASAMDSVVGGPVLAAVSSYWFEVTPQADTEAVGRAVEPGSRFRRRLATLPAGATVTCITKPDSYDAARTLQTFLQSRSQRLALLPTPADLPAIFSPSGTAVMSQ